MRSFSSLLFILPLMIVCACDKLLIKPDPNSNPEKNFEIFWNDINNTYPFFDRDKINWDSIYKIYRPKVNSNSTEQELFEIFKNMLRPLSDGHISLRDKAGRVWVNERHYAYKPYFNFKNINQTYLNNQATSVQWPYIDNRSWTDSILRYGDINSNILYYNIRTFYTDFKFEDNLKALLKAKNYKGIIVDVRNNGGGFLLDMQNTLGIFTNYPRTYGYTKQKLGPLNTYTGYMAWTFGSYNSNSTFSGKMVVLTNRYTFSAAEHCRMAMKTLPNVTSVGDTTGGALSPIIERQLPNGMKYVVVSSITYDLNLKSFEKIGIAPDITVITPASDSIAKRDDMVEKAIQLLQ